MDEMEVCFYVRCDLSYKIRDDLSSENLELLVLEITRLRSRPFLVSTWYTIRPPDSPVSVFNDFGSGSYARHYIS